MAEHRSSARQSNRHTGREYGKGYPYQMDQEFRVEFGPFDGFNKYPRAGTDRGTLFDLENGIILNGTIGPVWSAADRDIGKQLLGMSEMTVNGIRYQVQFRDDAGTDIDVITIDKAGTVVTNESTVAHGNGEISAVPWGNRIYFVNEIITDLQFLNIVSPAFGTISSTVDKGKFIFVLDNNMVIIVKNTTTLLWEAHWSVDSDPTDWANAGSGNNPFAPDLGEPYGFGHVGERVVVLFERGAVGMIPTGTIPTFRFVRERGIQGCGADRGVASDGTTLFYVNRKFQLVAFRGGREITVGEGVLQWQSDTRLFYSLAAGAAVVLESSKGVYLVDGDTLQYVARRAEIDVQLAADRPTTNNRGILDLQKLSDGTGASLTLRYWGATGPDAPIIITHDVTFPQKVQISRIELVFGDDYVGTSAPAVLLLTGATNIVFTSKSRDHSHIIYDGIAVVDNFALQITYGSGSDYDDILREIIVFCRVTTDDDIEVLA